LPSLRPIACCVALSLAGSAAAAGSTAPEVLPLSPSASKTAVPAKSYRSAQATPPNSHHEMRGTLMPDGTVKLVCVQAPGSLERPRDTRAQAPTEAK
jgi:hypothetical protein